MHDDMKKNLSENDSNEGLDGFDAREAALARAIVERWGPQAVESIDSIKTGLVWAVLFYEDLIDLAGELSDRHHQVEFQEAYNEIINWNWGLGGIRDAVSKVRSEGDGAPDTEQAPLEDPPIWFDAPWQSIGEGSTAEEQGLKGPRTDAPRSSSTASPSSVNASLAAGDLHELVDDCENEEVEEELEDDDLE